MIGLGTGTQNENRLSSTTKGFRTSHGFLNPNLVTLASIKHYPCLVLFGEPGLGKSTALTEESHASRQSAETVSLFRDLAIVTLPILGPVISRDFRPRG